MKIFDLDLLEGGPLPTLVSVPTEPAAERPVLVFLHGYEEGAPTDIRVALSRHGPLNPGSAEGARREFIVVAPQLPERGDLWPAYADEALAVVRQVQLAYNGDRRRTCLTGFSFGGNGVFDLALAEPAMWSALWPVDPTRVPAADPGLPVWLSSGQVSRSRRSGFISRLSLEEAPAVPGDRVYEDRGLDHVGTAAAAYADDAVYEWLLAYSR